MKTMKRGTPVYMHVSYLMLSEEIPLPRPSGMVFRRLLNKSLIFDCSKKRLIHSFKMSAAEGAYALVVVFHQSAAFQDRGANCQEKR